MVDIARDYFDSLFDASLSMIARLPWSADRFGIREIDHELRATAARLATATAFRPLDSAVARALAASRYASAPAGMNTVGLLLDRLSIMSIKYWHLRRGAGGISEAEKLRAGAVDDVIAALSVVHPGHASLTAKVTSHVVEDVGSSFNETYVTLLVTNFLLWESQEVLYRGNLQLMCGEELRAYVTFFSRENVRRNACISAIETSFWMQCSRLL